MLMRLLHHYHFCKWQAANRHQIQELWLTKTWKWVRRTKLNGVYVVKAPGSGVFCVKLRLHVQNPAPSLTRALLSSCVLCSTLPLLALLWGFSVRVVKPLAIQVLPIDLKLFVGMLLTWHSSAEFTRTVLLLYISYGFLPQCCSSLTHINTHMYKWCKQKAVTTKERIYFTDWKLECLFSWVGPRDLT